MECEDKRLLEQWADHWRDLVDFEFVPVRARQKRSRSSRRNFELPLRVGMMRSAEPGQQSGQFRPVLFRQRYEFQT